MTKNNKPKQSLPEPIEEGQGRFPWWIWAAILIWLLYAFLIGPFDLTSPGR